MIKKYNLNNFKVYEGWFFVKFVSKKYGIVKVFKRKKNKHFKYFSTKDSLVNSHIFNDVVVELRNRRWSIAPKKRGEIVGNVISFGNDRELIENFLSIEARTYFSQNRFFGISYGELLKEFYLAKMKSGQILAQKSDNQRYISFELEFISSLSRSEISSFLVDNLEKDIVRKICLVNDGSIATDEKYRYAHELKILCAQNEFKSVLSKISKILLDENFFTVNTSCGMHVHLDARHNNATTMYNNLKKIKSLLFAIVPPSRRDNRYCSFRLVKSCRYRAINYVSYFKHKTIEVRCHSATLDDRKIAPFAELLIATAYAENLPNKLPLRLNKILSLLGISGLENYFSDRIRKFNSDEIILRRFFGKTLKNDNNINNLQRGDAQCV